MFDCKISVDSDINEVFHHRIMCGYGRDVTHMINSILIGNCRISFYFASLV